MHSQHGLGRGVAVAWVASAGMTMDGSRDAVGAPEWARRRTFGTADFGLAGGWRLEDLAWLQQGRVGTNRGAIRVVPFGPGQGDVYVGGEGPEP